MRRALLPAVCLAVLAVLAGCSSSPSMAAADRAICDSQEATLQTVRDVVTTHGGANATAASGAASTALDDVNDWTQSVKDPNLQIIVARIQVGLVDIQTKAGNGLTDADLDSTGVQLDDLSRYCAG